MRARFTIAEVQTAALQIVDRDGLAGLSMRSLASALKTGPMTLYNYVRDRDELEELVAEAVIAGLRVPPPQDSWPEDVRAIATAMWLGVRAHPNAVPLVLTRGTVSSSSYAAAEGLIEALSHAGLCEADLLAAFRGVLSLVMGGAQVELTGPLDYPGRDREPPTVPAHVGTLAGSEHRHIAALAEVSQRSTATDDFARALDLLLAGIQSRSAGLTIGTSDGPAVD